MPDLQTDRAQEDGCVVFRDGSTIKVDVIMHCTGYTSAAYLQGCNSFHTSFHFAMLVEANDVFPAFMLSSYLYDFPFLGDDSTITVEDNCVDPLYKHVFPIEVAPDLSFIGLPWKVNLGANCLPLFRYTFN